MNIDTRWRRACCWSGGLRAVAASAIQTHGHEPTREAAMAAFAKSWRGRSNRREKSNDQRRSDRKVRSGHVEAPRPKGRKLEGRQKDLAADIVVALEALGLWKETSPT